MAALLDTKWGIGLACAAAVAIGAGGVVWLQRAPARLSAPTPAPAPAREASSWDRPIGPGALPASGSVPSGAATLLDAGTDSQAFTDAKGQLVADARLHGLFDTYLLKAKPDERPARSAQLHAFLKGRLAQPALGQAETLADAYLRYLQAEEEMRAHERFTRPDPEGLSEAQVDQMLAWLRQRGQLRERMLGAAVARAWYGADDDDCAGALADWEKMRAPPGSDEVDSNELRARRLHGAMLEARRNAGAQACASRLIGGLAQNG